MRTAITSDDHAPTEMVLARQCADVSKHLYHMRIKGDVLNHDLASFDGQLRASVSNSVCDDLPDHSWWQATTGGSCGGLGLRTAVGVALPSFIASLIMSRPLVTTAVDHVCAAFRTPTQPILSTTRTDEALARLVSTLSTAAAQELLSSTKPCLSVVCGATCSLEPKMPCATCPFSRRARGITPDGGVGDDEHPLFITACVDSGVLEGLLLKHEGKGS